MPSTLVEEKVIEKIRRVLIADLTINSYVKKRIYGSHISNVPEPIYPAISLHLLSGVKAFSERGFVTVNIQIDTWLLKNVHDQSDMFRILDRIRALLDRQNLVDLDIPIKVGVCVETSTGQMMSDPDVNLMHFPLIYQMVAS